METRGSPAQTFLDSMASPEVCEGSFIVSKKVGGPAVCTGIICHGSGKLEFRAEEFQISNYRQNDTSPRFFPLC